MKYLSTEEHNKMIKYQKMVDEIDLIKKIASKESEINTYCGEHNDCSNCPMVVENRCVLRSLFYIEENLDDYETEEGRKIITDAMDKIDPNWDADDTSLNIRRKYEVAE